MLLNKDQHSICRAWTKGQCTGMRGNCCPNRHFFLDGDRELLQQGSRDTVTTNQGNTGTEEEFMFSSPLTVRVRREVARERREEVDLETGSRRSWVETRELEVLDLTGNFPRLALSVVTLLSLSLQDNLR